MRLDRGFHYDDKAITAHAGVAIQNLSHEIRKAVGNVAREGHEEVVSEPVIFYERNLKSFGHD